MTMLTPMTFTVYRPSEELRLDELDAQLTSGVTFTPITTGGGWVVDDMYWDDHLLATGKRQRGRFLGPEHGDLIVFGMPGQLQWCAIYNPEAPIPIDLRPEALPLSARDLW